MLIESVATSLAIGKVRGGKVKNIGNIDIKKYYLFIAGFGLEFLSVYLNSKDLGSFSELLDKYFIFVHSISYILIFTGLIFNFNKKSMILVFVGSLLNYIVIAANGGHMPVLGDGLQYLGLNEYFTMLKNNAIITHTLITENTKFFFLGDIIPTPKFYPMPKMISIGDVFIGVGIFMIIQMGMFKED